MECLPDGKLLIVDGKIYDRTKHPLAYNNQILTLSYNYVSGQSAGVTSYTLNIADVKVALIALSIRSVGGSYDVQGGVRLIGYQNRTITQRFCAGRTDSIDYNRTYYATVQITTDAVKISYTADYISLTEYINSISIITFA